MKLAEEKKVILVTSALDLNTGDPATTKGINMKGYHNCTFLIDIGTMTVANATIKVWSGATDMDLASEVAFKYAYGASTSLWAAAGTTPASGADILAAETTAVAATGLVVVQATYPNFMLMIEVDASDMDVANEEEWLSISITCGTAEGLVTIFAILDPRYTSNRSATALA